MAFQYEQQAPQMPDTSYSNYLKSAGTGSGFGNFLGSLFGGYKNWADSQLAAYQNSYNQWQQNYTNAYNEWYNSPTHQSQLYEDAGFNKTLIASQATGSSSNSMSPISAQVPDVTDVGKNGFGSIASLIAMATSIIGLKKASAEAAIASSNADIAGKTAEDVISQKKFMSMNEFQKYQLGLQKGYTNDYLYGTSLFPQQSLIDSKAIQTSPFMRRYAAETAGIDIINNLRTFQTDFQKLNIKQKQNYIDNIMDFENKMIQNRASISDIDAMYYKLNKDVGLSKVGADFVIDLLGIFLPRVSSRLSQTQNVGGQVKYQYVDPYTGEILH